MCSLRLWQADCDEPRHDRGISHRRLRHLAEAGDLAARIARIHSGRGGLDLLTSYGIERREQWEFLLGLRGRLRPTPSAPLVVARNASRLLPCLPATGDEMALYADQLGLVIED